MAGGNFPSRVATSLMESFHEESTKWIIAKNTSNENNTKFNRKKDNVLKDVLVTRSRKEFEDTAFRLMRSKTMLPKLKQELLFQIGVVHHTKKDEENEEVGTGNENQIAYIIDSFVECN